MLPPFTAVDVSRVDTLLPLEERRVLRRSRPERLRFEAQGLLAHPPFTLDEPRPRRRPSALRIRLGEALMALGQRLAGADLAS